jgi:hypothetical protein
LLVNPLVSVVEGLKKKERAEIFTACSPMVGGHMARAIDKHPQAHHVTQPLKASDIRAAMPRLCQEMTCIGRPALGKR